MLTWKMMKIYWLVFCIYMPHNGICCCLDFKFLFKVLCVLFDEFASLWIHLRMSAYNNPQSNPSISMSHFWLCGESDTHTVCK